MIYLHNNVITNNSVKFNWESNLSKDWSVALTNLIESDYADDLINFVEQIYLSKQTIYPHKQRLFRPFKICDINDIKIVMIDDAPPTVDNASGLGRGVVELNRLNAKIPVELLNMRDCIYRSIYNRKNFNHINFDSSLIDYAEDGVLILNASMCKSSEQDYRIIWKNFIREVIKAVNKEKKDVIFLFLTNNNSDFYDLIDKSKNYIVANNSRTITLESDIFLKTEEIMRDKYGIADCVTW